MRTFDVEALLLECSPEAPSGENLEYEDPLFLEMHQAAEGKPAQQMGDHTIPAEEPSWTEVKKKALELASRTKDFRVVVPLIQAMARTDGFEGLRDALLLLRGYVQQYWDTVHPQLDPEEDNDPTERINVLEGLKDRTGEFAVESPVLAAVRDTPLVTSKQLRCSFGFRDVLIARGESPFAGDGEPPTESQISGAATETDLDEMRTTAEACAEARDTVIALEADLTERVGQMQAPDLSGLPALLGQVHAFLAEQLAARGVGTAGLGGEEAVDVAGGGGEIRSREEVIRALERISRYYEAREPSSPIPLLMERARRLVHANFIELVTDLAPDGLSQIENLRGRRAGQDDASD